MGKRVATELGAGSGEKPVRADRVHDLFWRRDEAPTAIALKTSGPGSIQKLPCP
jgi:hypothetical protein